MLDLVEKMAVAALGAAAITQRMGEELAAEMKEKYRMSEEEGKQFMDRLQAIARTSNEKVQQVAETEVKKVVDRLGLVTREEYDVLQKRVQQLEERLQGP